MTPAQFLVGTANLPFWQADKRERQRISDIDSLSGTYHAARGTTLNAGDACPSYPGMIITDIERTQTAHDIFQIDAEGSLTNTSPTKVLESTRHITLEEGWHQRTRRLISWLTEPHSITGDAATDTITDTAHGYSNGQALALLELTGGAGLTANNETAWASYVYVINKTTDTYQLSATVGGSAINFTTNITAGKVVAAEFAPGAAHPDAPLMFLTDIVTTQRGSTPWRNAELTYQGMETQRPYIRTISGGTTSAQTNLGGAQTVTANTLAGYPPSSVSTISLTGPKVVEYDRAAINVTDVYFSTSAPSTSLAGQPWAPPNPPDVTVLTLYGDEDKYFFPFAWVLKSVNSRQIPGRNLWLVSYNYTYQPPTIPIATGA